MQFRLFLLLTNIFLISFFGASSCLGQVTAKLVTDSSSVKPGSSFQAGVLLQHQPHWHTYWKNSETGYPPEIQWKLPEGWTITPQEWPTPEIYSTGTSVDYIFTGDTLLRYTITVPQNVKTGEASIEATAGWLMCKEMCLPVDDIALKTQVTVGKSLKKSPEAAIFKKTEIDQPQTESAWNIQAFDEQQDILLKISSETGKNPGKVYFFSETQGTAFEAEQIQETKGKDILLRIHKSKEGEIHSIKGVLKAENGWDTQGTKGLLVDTTLQPIENFSATPQSTPSNESSSILKILAWGFIGGLILNLMPCVFPVLGIKVMGFVSQAGSSKKKITLHALIFTSGILISFWVLVAVFITLKLAGESLGWGFQLQYPGTTYFMAAFILLFALNMSGVFEVGQSAIGVGSQLQHKGGYTGSLFSGVLATVVATPCSAPFLGTALGYAVMQPPAIMFLIFTFVALGLSSPYLLLSVFPNLIKLLPRPGAWMESFKQFMAFLLYATVAYLIWILAKQVELESLYGTYGLLKALLSLILLALAAWIYGRWASFGKPKKTRRIATLVVCILTIISLYYGYPKSQGTLPQEANHHTSTAEVSPAFTGESNVINWEKWAPGKAEKLAAEGHIVWVDFTARWCVTCQTNKATIFSSKEVQDAFRENKVIALKADWTNRDPRITQELAKWGKAAVPFNLLYTADKPIKQMPTILTPASVVEALPQK